MRCYFHKSDLDGICSGAIVKYKYPECEMIGVDYGDDIESLLRQIEMEEVVFIVDFSFPRGMMSNLHTEFNLHWIDHHKTAIEACKELDLVGKREIGKAGCELTWEYLFPERDMPEVIKLLGRYDVWDNKNINYWEKAILPFQYGMKNQDLGFSNEEMELWKTLFFYNQEDFDVSSMLNNIQEEGLALLRYQNKQNKKILENNSFEREFHGLKAICLNNQVFNSQVFDSLWDEDKYDIMICFAYTGKHWKVSLYSTKENVDCSELAKEMGGGGHKGAAGFVCENIDFLFD